MQAHVELRSEHLLTPEYFGWLDERGIDHVFSHWTWLPMIREQWKRCGKRFTAADRSAAVRLLTPRNMKYQEAYAYAYPFDKPVSELSKTQQVRDMVADAAALVFQGERKHGQIHLINNNRSWGNAPELARTIAHRVLDEVERSRRIDAENSWRGGAAVAPYICVRSEVEGCPPVMLVRRWEISLLTSVTPFCTISRHRLVWATWHRVRPMKGAIEVYPWELLNRACGNPPISAAR